jgi:hypothetical protein
MKAVFGVLLCYVLFASQCFAIKGGPIYSGPSNVTATGTFAGVLLPNEFSGSNSIGLFSINLPTTGLGTGPLFIFQTGETYTGTIQGIVDPDSAKFFALLNATFPFITTIQTGTDTNGNPTFTSETVVASASGRLNGQLAGTSQNGSSSTRITGTADVQFAEFVNKVDSEIVYDVFGFRQGG